MAKENNQRILTDQRIGILGKGGSGKSTVTVLMARAFQRFGYQVNILDADSTNIGLFRALGFSSSPVSLLDYFGGTEFSGGLVSCPVDNPAILPESTISLKDLPQKYYRQKSGLNFLVAGKIGDRGPGAGCDGPISKITRDLRITDSGSFPVTLIDLKAGLEDFARGMVTSLDWIITVVDPNIAAVQIAVDIKNLVWDIKAGKQPATKHLKSKSLIREANRIYRQARIKNSFAILNKIDDPKIEQYLAGNLEGQEVGVIGVLRQASSLSSSWLKGEILTNQEAEDSLEKVINNLQKEALNEKNF
jgi:CO dehydrogenase maturation factor